MEVITGVIIILFLVTGIPLLKHYLGGMRK